MAQTRKLDWGAKRSTEVVNKRLNDIIKPGVYYGYYVEADGATMNLSINRNGDSLQVLVTTEGKVVLESADLASAVTIPAADSTDPRIDLVVAKQQHTPAGDPQTYEVVEGTPAGSPSAPSVPAYAIKLCEVYVAAGVTSISQSDISEQAHVTSPMEFPIQEDGFYEGKFKVLNVGSNMNLSIDSDGVGTLSLDASMGTTYVQDDDPSTVAGGSNDIGIGDRWIDTNSAPTLARYIAQSSWSAGDPTDWLEAEYDTHAAEHESGGGDEVDATNLQNVGNASGNVPISNGTVNTNLNADQLDGNEATDFASASTYASHDHSAGDPTQVDHSNLTGVGANDHHARDHDINSTADHNGVAGSINEIVALDSNGLPKSTGHTEGAGGGLNADQVDGNDATTFAFRSNNLSDLASASTARTNLGLGTAATHDEGPGNGLDADTLDGSHLSDITSQIAFDEVIDRDDYGSDALAGAALKTLLQNSSVNSIFVKDGIYAISGGVVVAGSKLVIGDGQSRIDLDDTFEMNASPQYFYNLIFDGTDGGDWGGGNMVQTYYFDGSTNYFNEYGGFFNCEFRNVTNGRCLFGNRGSNPNHVFPSIVGCVAHDADYGFHSVINMSNCSAESNTTSNYWGCHNLWGCRSHGALWGFRDCVNMSGCVTSYQNGTNTANGHGFDDCSIMSSCHAEYCDNTGFYECTSLSSCTSDFNGQGGATTNGGQGFWKCEELSSCQATNNQLYDDGAGGVSGGNGFYGCDYISSCISNSNDAHGFGGDVTRTLGVSSCTADNNGSSTSAGNVGYAFTDCDNVSACHAGNSNTAGKYNNCNYMDDNAVYSTNAYSVD